MQRNGDAGRVCGRVLGSLFAVVAGLFAAPSAQALDPDRAIGQLTHVWYENQLPQGTVLSIAQRRDGSLWLATYGGLVRHSGAGFDTIDPRVAPALESSAITAVGADRDGTLWVGTLNGGLYTRGGRDLRPVPLPDTIDSVFGIVQDHDGDLWLTTNAGVARLHDGTPQLLGEDAGFPPRGFYRAIVADPVGGVWIAADGLGVVRWRDGRVEIFDEGRGLPTNAVYSLAIAADGTPWVGTQAGPARFDGERFVTDPRLQALAGKRIYSLFGDRDGSVWFAPLDMGLCRLTATRFDCDDTLPGLRGETVRSMFEDREGNLWVGTTSSGVHRFSNSKLVTATGPLASNAVRAVHEQRDGTLWVGTDGAGLARYVDQQLDPAPALNLQLPSQLVRAIETDVDGHVWVGGTEGVTRFDADGRARQFGIADGLPGTIVFAFAPAQAGGLWTGTLQGVARIVGDTVEPVEATRGDDTRALYEDPSGRLWIGLRSGLRCLQDGVLDQCGTDGLPGVSVFAFHADGDDLWLGTSLGLKRLRGGRVEDFTQRAGFYGDAVFAILDDGMGNFWVSSNRGLAKLAKADLERLGRGEITSLEPRWYGKNDGMLSSQANGASQTPAVRTRDGRLWFGTANGLVMVDPANQRTNTQPPPVAVERLLVDGRAADPTVAGRFGPGVERLELQYAAMSYVAPAAVRYRYRMEGFDRAWHDAGDTRVAYYTNLPPGDYTFHVIASNNDGVWNTDGARMAFTIVPHWYQTWWFRVLAVVAALAALGGIYRVRVWQLRDRERALTREVAQRTEALRDANDKLRRLASRDGLTGIANRASFDQALQLAWRLHADRGAPLSVLLADIDAFKAYNDTYGHLAGDAALSAVAAALSFHGRDGDDVVARYGGEEFAVLLTDCDHTQATAVAHRLCDAVRALDIDHRSSGVAPHVTISVGVASKVPEAGAPVEALLRQADEALYRAKDAGRDRVA